MRSYRARISPKSAFGTPLKGDTLFGQLCWAARNIYGIDRLTLLLDGYIAGRPYAVISDAFPADYLPRPSLPTHWFVGNEHDDLKSIKKRVWMPLAHFEEPVAEWLRYSEPSSALNGAVPEEHPQPHNTLNRETGRTGVGEFAPYSMLQSVVRSQKCSETRAGFDASRFICHP